MELQTRYCEWHSIWHRTQEYEESPVMQLYFYNQQRRALLHKHISTNREKRICAVPEISASTVYGPRPRFIYHQSGPTRQKGKMCGYWHDTWQQVSCDITTIRWSRLFNQIAKYKWTWITKCFFLMWLFTKWGLLVIRVALDAKHVYIFKFYKYNIC